MYSKIFLLVQKKLPTEMFSLFVHKKKNNDLIFIPSNPDASIMTLVQYSFKIRHVHCPKGKSQISN